MICSTIKCVYLCLTVILQLFPSVRRKLVNKLRQVRHNPGPGGYKLSMKFQLSINLKIAKTRGKFWFKTQKLVIYPAHKSVVILTFLSRNFSSTKLSMKKVL